MLAHAALPVAGRLLRGLGRRPMGWLGVGRSGGRPMNMGRPGLRGLGRMLPAFLTLRRRGRGCRSPSILPVGRRDMRRFWRLLGPL
jgi:hypothetical protein